MPMPKMIKSALGLSDGGVMVQENQSLEWAAGDSRALMTSTSYPMIKGGERFETKMIIEYSRVSEGKCHATIRVQFTATIWGMAQMLEKFMSEQAQDAFAHFLEFIYLWLKQLERGFCTLADVRTLDELRRMAPEEAASVYDMEFYDALETGYITPKVPNNEAALSVEDERKNGFQLTVDSWFMHSVMKDLSNMRVHADAMRGVAEDNQLNMEHMQAELAHLRRSVDRTSLFIGLQVGVAVGAVGVYAAHHYMPLISRLVERCTSR
uniref:Uncharacterized protein n=1 Tax=Pyramimonas obovata TaxID=1411642 RepID=A0A7S0MWQ3_9CHLO